MTLKTKEGIQVGGTVVIESDGLINFNKLKSVPAFATLASPALSGLPTAPTATAGTSTNQIATTAFTQTAIANLVAASPAALDTLNELATALGNDPSFATTVNNSIALKAPISSPVFTGSTTSPAFVTTTNGSGRTLSISGNAAPSVNQATVTVSNGNLHIDPANGYAIYLNHLSGSTGGVNFSNGAGNVVASVNSSGTITANGGFVGNINGGARMLTSPDGDRLSSTKLPTSNANSVRYDFVIGSEVGSPGSNYAGLMTYAPWTGTTASTGDASYQFAFASTATNGSGQPRLKIRNGIDSTWNTWYDVWTSASLSNLSQLTNGPGYTNNLGTLTAVTATGPVISSGGTTPVISIPAATTSVSGYLTSADWTTFNNKQVAGTYATGTGNASGTNTGDETLTTIKSKLGITTLSGANTGDQVNITGTASTITGVYAGTITSGQVTTALAFTPYNSTNPAGYGTGTLTAVTGTGPVISSGGTTPVISIPAATTSVSGYLTSTDWTTFNNKQVAGTYATGTGTASGTNTGDQTNISGNAATVSGLRVIGTITVQAVAGSIVSCTTAQFVAWYQANYNFLGYTFTTAKCSWDYNGNNDIADTSIGACEMAGCIIETSSDGTQYTIRITRPTTGTGGFVTLVYNNQGSSYAPAWRTEISSANYNTFSPTLTGGNASGTWSINVTGNSATATNVAYTGVTGKPTNILGYGITDFLSSNANTPITSAGNNTTVNAVGYVSGTSLFSQTDGALHNAAYSNDWQHQIFGDFRTGQIAIRGKNNTVWQPWRTVWDSSNLTNLNQLTNGPGYGTGTLTAVTATGPVVSSGGTTPVISIPAATTSVAGYLTAADWTTFNSKQVAGTYATGTGNASGTNTGDETLATIKSKLGVTTLSGANTGDQVNITGTASTITGVYGGTITSGQVTTALTYTPYNATNPAGYGTGTLTAVTATGPVVSSGGTTPVISIPAATTSVAGYLTAADWTTFNAKAPTANPVFTGTATLPIGSIAPGLLGSSSPSVTAAGSNQATAAVLTSDVNIITTAATGTGVVVQGATSGKYAVIVNRGSNAISVYPSSGHQFDGLAVNVAISLPINGFLEMFGSSSTQWHTTTNAIINGSMVIGNISGNSGNVTGTVSISNGGTGQTTSSAALSALGGYPSSNPNGYSTTVGTVTSVTATGPIVSSGGATPVISIPAATSTVAGHLAAADWTTFNNKQPAGTYATGGGTATGTNTGDQTSVSGNAGTSNNLLGGVVGVIPYQSAANTTAFLATGTVGQTLICNGAAAPSWGTPTAAGSGGAVGGGTDKLFYYNDTAITSDYTTIAGKNAMVAGPITINNGITLTVSDNTTLTIV